MSVTSEPRRRWLPAPAAHYFAYTRPLTLFPTFVLVATGYALAPAQSLGAVLSDLTFLFLVYSVLGWGGSSAFNSSQDRDSGKVNLLNNSPPLPQGLAAFGLALSVCSVVLCAVWPGKMRVLPWALACGILSTYYSWKTAWWTRGKDIPGVDVLIHSVGSGIVTIGLGLAAGGQRSTLDLVWVATAFSVALLGGYPTTQIFQLEGRTHEKAFDFTSWLGPDRALRFGAAMFFVHAALLIAWWVVRESRLCRKFGLPRRLAFARPRVSRLRGWVVNGSF